MRSKRKTLAALKLHHAAMSVAAVALTSGVAHATTLFWDPGTHASPVAGGSGTWNVVANWSTDPNTYTQASAAPGAGDIVALPSTVGTISNSTGVAAQEIDFFNSASGYNISAPLTIGSGGINISGTSTGQTLSGAISGSSLLITKGTNTTTSLQLALTGTNNFTGDIILAAAHTPTTSVLRMNFNSAGAIPSTANILCNTTNCLLDTSSLASLNIASTTTVNLNHTGGGNFTQFVGANGAQSVTFNGLITATAGGTADLVMSTGLGPFGGTAGVVVINHSSNTYGGNTIIASTTATTTTSSSKGWLVIGGDNALSTNDLYDGSPVNNLYSTGNTSGVLDLQGHNQTFKSINSGTNAANTAFSTGAAQGITNSGATLSTLTVTGSNTSVFNAAIGTPTIGNASGTNQSIPSPAAGHDLNAIALNVTGTGSLTLGASTNSYSGNTTVNGGGTLLINANNSSTTASATITNGSRFGGSGTYAGSVTLGDASTSAKLLPGGTGTIGTFKMGALTLNPSGNTSGASADFDFGTTSADAVVSTGSLTLPTGGTEDLNLAFGATVVNGLFPLFKYTGATLSTAQFNTLNKIVTVNGGAPGGGMGFALQNNTDEVDLQVTGGVDSLLWKGDASGNGTWDTNASNQPWTASGTASAYSEAGVNGAPVVNFDDSSNPAGAATNTITVTGTVQPFGMIFNNSLKSYVLNGGTIGGTGGLSKNGTGSLAINNTLSYSADTVLNGGTTTIGSTGAVAGANLNVNNAATLVVSSGASVTSTNLNVNNGGTLTVNSGATLGAGTLALNTGGSATIVTGAAINGVGTLSLAGGTLHVTGNNTNITTPTSMTVASTIDTGANTVTYSGMLTSSATAAITKIGAGTLVLDNAPAPATYAGGWIISAGTILVNAVGSDADPADSLGGTTGLGGHTGTTTSVSVKSGATLTLANVAWGNYQVDTNALTTFLADGSEFVGTGTSSYGRDSFALQVDRGTVTAPATVDIIAPGSSDSLNFLSSVRQSTNTAGAAFTTIRVNNGGSGKVLLRDGGSSSLSIYAGSWAVNGGILQIGPVIENKLQGSSGYQGPFGEPLNALGFVGTGGTADPDVPNPVAVNSGAILALADDAANTNPHISFPAVNPTPNYLRNPITLNGGALAATGSEVSFADENDLGAPTGAPVVAHFGGDITMTGAITSKILTYNPSSTSEARTVQLVGGQRTLQNASPAYPAGQVLTYAINWAGTLEVDPGSTTTGSFDIIRGDGNYGDAGNGGTVTVASGSLLQIDNNGIVNLGGSLDALSDGTHFVNVTTGSSALLHVTAGTKNVGTVEGAGNTTVNSGATLIATHIRQNTLTVNGTARVRADGTSAATSVVTTLNATSGKLDLSNNKLVVTNGNAGIFVSGAYTGISGLAHAGRNTGAWDGSTGLVTSQALAASGVAGLAVASAADVKDFSTSTTALFGGQTVHASDVLVMYTYNGDANLDGRVNADDYFTIDKNYNKSGSLFGYTKGDFNYDGVINGDDYAIIDAGFAGQGSQLPGAPALGGVSAVPEPASVAMIAFGLSGLGLRRRRR